MSSLPLPPSAPSVGEPPATLPRPKGSLLYSVIVPLVLALTAGGTVIAVRHARADDPTPEASALPVPALAVTAITPHQAIWPDTLVASGAVAPWQEASIGSEIGGYPLIDVLVNVGDVVRKGQVLARLDPALLRADEAELQATYDQAAANQQRALSLKVSGTLSDKDILQSVTEAKTSRAQLAAKQLQLRYTEIVAPDDGVISARTATLGAVVSVGQELFRLIRQNRLEWRGELTAQQLDQIVAGQRVSLSLPDGSTAMATVRQTAPILDGQTRLGLVYADIDPGSHARAGMYANGNVILSQSKALVVPAESVVIRDGRPFVLKLKDRGVTSTVLMQGVSLGRSLDSDVEILQGLDDKDHVVVQGAGFLNDGDNVRIVVATSQPKTFQ